MPISRHYENQYIGCNIRRHRLRLGMSEDVLAGKISQAYRKITVESLKALEQGAYRPSPMRLYHIARALKVCMEELVG